MHSAGDLGSVLRIASELPRLASLDLTNQYLEGTIPSGLSFPLLQTLLLRSNNIQVLPTSSPQSEGADAASSGIIARVTGSAGLHPADIWLGSSVNVLESQLSPQFMHSSSAETLG